MKNFNTFACTLTLLAAGLLSACGKSDQTSAAAAPAASSAAASRTASEEGAASTTKAAVSNHTETLDVTVAEYKKNFDRIMKLSKTPFRANFRLKTQDNAFDGYLAILNDNLSIMITADKKSGKITNVLLHGTGDGTKASGADIVVVAVAALSSVFPDGKADEVGPEIIRLMQDYQDGDDTPASRTFNGVKFSHTRSPETGALFAAQPA
ncbi:hypothetical protein [Burkholderia ubonensis]|uniref:hypothetical protein n=1 Tax=Burkholderia ubonensis TaxID=101571 RepID=UPI00075B53E1|nr:hypothetical protein [Burkholderia ubonensis]KVA17050.1 hypothetical protein WI43_21600 [Burkholderia ubonensis]KVA17479.1 hypothetical protein WI42_00780 [Burkholderia ubonensis]